MLLSALLCWLAPRAADAFCGFYVAGADTRLYNNASMVVMMRDGTRTVLAMQNNYQGPPENFAMVVPVPVVLSEDNVKTLSNEVFERVDTLASPRLVEYWEQDPCMAMADPSDMASAGPMGGSGTGMGFGRGAGANTQVVVEAEFAVGEYDIVILSAKDAMALETWLTQNGYKIPAGAADHLRPYVQRGDKFFVAKVDVAKVTYKDGMAMLSPLRVHYDSDSFTLPIRLGLINARDAQDLIVHILARNQRYQVANYNNVTIPTNLSVRDAVRGRFAEFYAALFDATLEKNPGSVVTEYAWDSSTCDPCPGTPLTGNELMTLGLDVLQENGPRAPSMAHFGSPTASGDMDRSLIMRTLRRSRQRFTACKNSQPAAARSPTNLRLEFTIKSTGRVDKATVSGLSRNQAMDKTFVTCVEKALADVRFPQSKGSGITMVKIPLRFVVASSVSRSRGLVLTRLHARYTKDNVGEDLVFEVAGPIRGGQGGGTPAEKSALSASRNTFQGRYIMHHEWTGAMACESPRRGIWGGPPADVANTVNAGRSPSTSVARDLAFAKRGAMTLTAVVSEPIVALDVSPTPESAGESATTAAHGAAAPPTPTTTPTTTAHAATPETPTTTSPPATQPAKRSQGCTLGTAASGTWLPFIWLLLTLALRRPRRRHVSVSRRASAV